MGSFPSRGRNHDPTTLAEKEPIMSRRLSDRMREDLRIRNYAAHTQTAYLDRVAKFVAHFNNRPPSQLGSEEIRSY